MRRPTLPLLIALALGAMPVTARATDRVAIERAAGDLKPLVVAEPAAALPRLARLRADAAGITAPSTRALALAAVARMEAEANLRLGRSNLAGPLIEKSIADVRRLAPTSALLPELLLSRGGLNIERVRVAPALADFHEAHDLFRRLRDAKSQAKALLSIAYLYLQAKDYESALKYIAQAEQVFRDDPLVLLSIYGNRAVALSELGRFRAAETPILEARNVARGLRSRLLEAQMLRNLVRTRLRAGHVDDAARAMAEVRRILPPGIEAEERANDALAAQIALERGHADDAERWIGRSFAGVRLDTTELSSREAHETAYRIYAAQGDDAKALAHLAALKRLDDQATKLATSTGTALMGARFDFANQELKIANLQRDEARRGIAFERARAEAQQTLFLGGAGAVAAIIVLLLVGLFTIRRSRDEVRKVAADLSVSNGALGKALAAKTEFLATTSHEIRTPLNGILGMTQVILTDRAIEPTLRDRIQLVHTAGTTMRALVDDILDVAKMETGNLTIEDAPFDPRATLRDAALLWEDQARARGLAFEVALDGCPTAMLGDVARVRQVAFNLLSNALKFTREGSVRLRAAADGDTLRIRIADTGIGIPRAKLEEVFESFRQADAGTTREFGGTGLGLSICRNLAEAMGGRVVVESEVGRGSTFTVTLPLRVPPAATARDVERESAVLVVERNPIARAMLRTVLAADGEVALVASGPEAIAWLEANEALAVLADAGTITAAEQATMAAAAAGKPLVLLCADEPTARTRGGDGWRAVARPIASARLVTLLFDRTVASTPDALATRAA